MTTDANTRILENGELELSDEMLDEIAGGAGENMLTIGMYCPDCSCSYRIDVIDMDKKRYAPCIRCGSTTPKSFFV